jgi:hypothetical protein
VSDERSGLGQKCRAGTKVHHITRVDSIASWEGKFESDPSPSQIFSLTAAGLRIIEARRIPFLREQYLPYSRAMLELPKNLQTRLKILRAI